MFLANIASNVSDSMILCSMESHVTLYYGADIVMITLTDSDEASMYINIHFPTSRQTYDALQ